MNIGVFAQKLSSVDRKWARSFIGFLKDNGYGVSLHKELYDSFQTAKLPNDLPFFTEIDNQDTHSMDYLISLGGDGTMLRAVNLTYKTEIPVLGINLGRLGFLASVDKKNARIAIDRIKKGEYDIQKRTLLELGGKHKLFFPDPVALNDFTVFKRDTSSMIGVHTYINGEFFNTYWSDGLIISTPTGSTGYSLSCGGPIVFPSSGNLVITPIAPHNLNVRPIVISDDSEISIRLEGRTDSFLCSLDSRFESINKKHQLLVRKSRYHGQVMLMRDYSYTDALREKLTWGFDKRSSTI